MKIYFRLIANFKKWNFSFNKSNLKLNFLNELMIRTFFFLFFFSFVIFCLNFSSFLNSLILLESLSLILFFHIFLLMFSFFSLRIVLFYFVFIVSERALGLAILVKVVKFFGSNNFRLINLTIF